MYKKIKKFTIFVLLLVTLCVVAACKNGNVNDDNKGIESSIGNGNSLPWVDIQSNED